MKTNRKLSYLSVILLVVLACNISKNQPEAVPTSTSQSTVTAVVVMEPSPVILFSTPTNVPQSANGFCAGDAECSRIQEIVENNPKLARPIRVSTDAPSCPQPKQGESCGIWSTGNHAFVTSYSNDWTASADFVDSFPIDAGMTIMYDHSDGIYVYVTETVWDQKYTFKMSEVTFMAPMSNVPGKAIYYWSVPVTSEWGPVMRSDTQPGTYPCYSYGLDIQFSLFEYYDDGDAQMATDTNPTGYPDAFVGRDDFASCQVLKIIPNNADGSVGGAWVLIDGVKLWSRFIYFNYWPDSFWAKNHIQPPQ